MAAAVEAWESHRLLLAHFALDPDDHHFHYRFGVCRCCAPLNENAYDFASRSFHRRHPSSPPLESHFDGDWSFAPLFLLGLCFLPFLLLDYHDHLLLLLLDHHDHL